jgi:hypothetical protein
MPATLGAGVLLASAVLVGACTTVVERQIIHYAEARSVEGRPIECHVELVEQEGALPPGCLALGDVFIGDEGSTFDCGRPRMVREATRELCRLGATHGWYWQVWDVHSSCYQVRAVGYACPAIQAAARETDT